jgi:co-chaperonin GroES (HSP10)
MSQNLNAIKGSLRAVGNRVLVTDMHFGEQTTAGGIIIKNDDGQTRGIYSRWAKVYAKGPESKEEYAVGDWILIEHGRWTRSILLNENGVEREVRMVETESVLAYSKVKPEGLQIGSEYADGEHATIDPSSFVTSLS